jgi:hypothetical protein
MKHLFQSALLIIILTACNTDSLFNFNIQNKTNIVIPSAIGVNTPFSIATPDITTSSNSEFQNNNTSADKVKDITLSNLSLTIKSPQGKSFSFLKTITIYISAQGLSEKKLAYKENISETGYLVVLTSTNEKLDEYIKKDKYSIRTEVTTDETLVQDVQVEAAMVFKVTAGL